MKKLAVTAAVLALAIAGVWAWWPSDAPAVSATEDEALPPLGEPPALVAVDAGEREDTRDGVAGRVVDARGQPVAGAVVALLPTTPTLLGVEDLMTDQCGPPVDQMLAALDALKTTSPAPVEQVTTGPDGTFRLTRAGSELDQLLVATHGGQSAHSLVQHRRLELVLAAPAPLTGRVHDREDRPIAGASVLVLSLPPTTAVSQADGRFEVLVPSGDVDVFAWHRDLLPALSAAVAGEDVELELGPRRRITGHVVEQGTPVAAASVTAVQDGCSLEVETTAQGRFVFESVGAKPTQLIARRQTAVAFGEADATEADLSDLVLALSQGELLDVTVLDGESHAPLPDANVNLAWNRGSTAQLDSLDLSGSPHDGPVDLSGTAHFGPLPPGRYALDVWHDGFTPFRAPVDLVSGKGVTLEVELQRAVRTRGHVVDARGEAVAGAIVSNGTAAVTSDARGAFALEGAADAGLIARALGFLPWAGPAEPPRAVRVVLERGASISGRVTEASGAPVRRAWVGEPGEFERATADATARDRSRLSGPDGTFSVTGYPPGSHVLVAVVFNDDWLLERTSLPTEVAVGQGAVSSVALVFAPQFTLTGITVDEAHQPVSDLMVIATCRSGSVQHPARSDAAGRFQLSLAGRCLLEAERPGWKSSVVTVTAETRQPLEVVVERRARVRGQVVTAAGEAVRRFALDDQSHETSDGRFEVSATGEPMHVEADRYAEAILPAVVESGPDVDLGRVKLLRPRHLSGRVLDPDGAPLEDVRVGVALSLDGTTTARDGTFELEAPQTEVEVVASHPDFPDQTVRVGERSARVEIRLRRGATVQIRLVDPNGDVLGCGRVFADHEVNNTPEPSGVFVLRGMRQGALELEAWSQGCAFSFPTAHAKVTTPADGTVAMDVVVVPPIGVLRLKLTGLSSRPEALVTRVEGPEGLIALRAAPAGPPGEFRVNRVPLGPVSVVVTDYGVSPPVTASDRVTVRRGEERVVSMSLR